jgi:hypothetical protein
LTHAVPPEHGLAHPPQFHWSVCVSAQLPLHQVLSEVQRATHLLLSHILSCEHEDPHLLQFSSSLVVSTHRKPHSVWPMSHAHLPDSQCESPGHM